MKSTSDDTVIAEMARLLREDPAYPALLEKMRRAQEQDSQGIGAYLREAIERINDPAYLHEIAQDIRLLRDKLRSDSE